MASHLQKLEKQLLKLSAHERAFLARQLIRSLDERNHKRHWDYWKNSQC